VILRRIVYVHLLHLPDWMRLEVNLDVIEPDFLVFIVRPDKAAVVGLVGDLDQDRSSLS